MNSNDSRAAALKAIENPSEAKIAMAIIYLGDRIGEGVIDREHTAAVESLSSEVAEISRALYSIGDSVEGGS